ncbi:hypothetical protein MMC19_004735 [Ptychographa xylographoides]|nr:hypothetical protein [Ptychographa xylographoides]
MADRFPSLEDFSEGQTEPRGNGNLEIDGLDDNDDFLTREKAALGDDAAQFAGPSDNVGASATIEDGEEDLLGGDESYGAGHTGGEEIIEFESSFPSIDTRNERVAPGGFITGSGIPTQSQPAHSSYNEPGEEPQVIKEWRERRDLALQHRAESSAAKKSETVKTAQTSIDDFYENYNTKKDKTISQTRKEAEEFLANREDTSAGGTSWERIAKLVDLSGKGARGGGAGTGKERFREILTNLRKDEHAPGASGV